MIDPVNVRAYKYGLIWYAMCEEEYPPTMMWIYGEARDSVSDRLGLELPQGGWATVDVASLAEAMWKIDFAQGWEPGTTKKIIQRGKNTSVNPGARRTQLTAGTPSKEEFKRLFSILPSHVATAAVKSMKTRRYEQKLAQAAFDWHTGYPAEDVAAICARFEETLDLMPGVMLQVASCSRPAHKRRFGVWARHHGVTGKKVTINGRDYLIGLSRD